MTTTIINTKILPIAFALALFFGAAMMMATPAHAISNVGNDGGDSAHGSETGHGAGLQNYSSFFSHSSIQNSSTQSAGQVGQDKNRESLLAKIESLLAQIKKLQAQLNEIRKQVTVEQEDRDDLAEICSRAKFANMEAWIALGCDKLDPPGTNMPGIDGGGRDLCFLQMGRPISINDNWWWRDFGCTDNSKDTHGRLGVIKNPNVPLRVHVNGFIRLAKDAIPANSSCMAFKFGTLDWGDDSSRNINGTLCNDRWATYTFTHTYEQAGTYTIVLKDAGGASIVKKTVTVSEDGDDDGDDACDSCDVHYFIRDVDIITKRDVDPNPDLADDEFTRYVITLEDGTIHVVKTFGNMQKEDFDDLFFATGYIGSVADLIALAVDCGVASCETHGAYSIKNVKTVTKRVVNQNSEAVDAAYTLYVVTLKDGTVHRVKQFGNGTQEMNDKAFRDTGYAGSISALRALATTATDGSYGIGDIKSVISKYVDPIPNAVDDEYTEYTITLKDGTVHKVRVGFLPQSVIEEMFRATGYTGSISALLALAKPNPSDAVVVFQYVAGIVSKHNEGSADERATFTSLFKVKAADEAIFISQSTIRGKTLGGAGLDYVIEDADGDVVSAGTASNRQLYADTGVATTSEGNFFRIPAGQTRSFVHQVTYNPKTTGSYHVQLHSVNYATSADKPTDQLVGTPASRFETRAVTIRDALLSNALEDVEGISITNIDAQIANVLYAVENILHILKSRI